jgi:CRISPR-associated protein Cst1
MMVREVSWTGHPFVDAGLSAIAAIVGVKRLEELNLEHLERAAEELERLMLSDQALGIGLERSFAKTSLSQIFPNSELVNPSYWKGKTLEEKAERVRQKFREALKRDLEMAKISLLSSGNATCLVCGRKVPEEATTFVRKDKMPLLIGIVNFYPSFAFGVKICGLCAFAVRFLPMSVMRTGFFNRLWFLHTQALEVAAKISKRYCWIEFNKAISANKPLDFYGKWQTAGDAGTVLYVLCELLSELGRELPNIFLHPLPTTAYIFSNDNQKPYIRPLPIPNDLLYFLARLKLSDLRAFERFKRELLLLPENLSEKDRKLYASFLDEVADRLLNSKSIIGMCIREGDKEKNEAPGLLGGWLAHALYLLEVIKVPENRLLILERLGLKIAQSNEAKKHIIELRTANQAEIYTIFLRYVREGWLTHNEFYTLFPPNSDTYASEIRDILLAVIYDWQNCQAKGEEFQSLENKGVITRKTEEEPEEIIQNIQQIGEQLLQKLPNISRWIGQLWTARSSDEIRRVYLSAVQRGAMNFTDFIFLAPLADRQKMWMLRDYLLAFLFERTREFLPKEIFVEETVKNPEGVG